VHDGASALAHVQHHPTDLVILDRDLPILDGDAVCRHLSATGHSARILMLTAAGDVADRVSGLHLGADDYLPKPFAYPELLARLAALARRGPSAGTGTIARGDLLLDLNRGTVSRAGVPIELSRTEYALLRALVVADGAILGWTELAEHAWDDPFATSKGALKTMIYSLRRKLGPPDPITAVHGRGYRLGPDA
jgi:DNA-binding response OmpR family regulator